MLGARATNKAERIAEFKKRKQRFAQRKVHPADREKVIAEGWAETGRQYKDGQIQVEKSKSHDEILENRFWSVLYHLGYDELNVGRKFKIQITDANNGQEVFKQVDVFAKDEDTVVIAECKSSTSKTSTSFQKDIMEFSALKKSFVKGVNHNGFIKYNQNLFAWEDQVRLRDCLKAAASRGAFVLMTNADHASVRRLYENFGDAHRLDRASILSASSLHRKQSSELAVTIGYDVGGRKAAFAETRQPPDFGEDRVRRRHVD